MAKSVIQVNAVDAGGRLVTNRQLSRYKFLPWCAQLPAGCSVAMEACGGSHYWARKLIALGLNVKIIAAHLVVHYRLQGKGGKNDANDTAAVCEAASRPAMHFVPVKTTTQQDKLRIHRLREGLKEERTAGINRIQGMLAEFGLVAPKSPDDLCQSLETAGRAGNAPQCATLAAGLADALAGATAAINAHLSRLTLSL